VFDDLDKGLVVKAFTFECDLRIGGGTSQPADGFSLNYVRASDPLATNGSPFAGTAGENDLPEEGSLTGLGIGFDTWQSGDHPGGIRDVVGISIRVEGQLLTLTHAGIIASRAVAVEVVGGVQGTCLHRRRIVGIGGREVAERSLVVGATGPDVAGAQGHRELGEQLTFDADADTHDVADAARMVT